MQRRKLIKTVGTASIGGIAAGNVTADPEDWVPGCSDCDLETTSRQNGVRISPVEDEDVVLVIEEGGDQIYVRDAGGVSPANQEHTILSSDKPLFKKEPEINFNRIGSSSSVLADNKWEIIVHYYMNDLTDVSANVVDNGLCNWYLEVREQYLIRSNNQENDQVGTQGVPAAAAAAVLKAMYIIACSAGAHVSIAEDLTDADAGDVYATDIWRDENGWFGSPIINRYSTPIDNMNSESDGITENYTDLDSSFASVPGRLGYGESIADLL